VSVVALARLSWLLGPRLVGAAAPRGPEAQSVSQQACRGSVPRPSRLWGSFPSPMWQRSLARSSWDCPARLVAFADTGMEGGPHDATGTEAAGFSIPECSWQQSQELALVKAGVLTQLLPARPGACSTELSQEPGQSITGPAATPCVPAPDGAQRPGRPQAPVVPGPNPGKSTLQTPCCTQGTSAEWGVPGQTVQFVFQSLPDFYFWDQIKIDNKCGQTDKVATVYFWVTQLLASSHSVDRAIFLAL